MKFSIYTGHVKYPNIPANYTVSVIAELEGLLASSRIDMPLCLLPAELLTASEEEMLAHPAMAPLVEEARTKLIERIQRIAKEVAA